MNLFFFFFFSFSFPFIPLSLFGAEFYYLNIFSMSRNIIIFNGAILTSKLIEFYNKISSKIKNTLGRILMENYVKLINDVKFHSLWISVGK